MKTYKINGHSLSYNNEIAVYDPVYDPYNVFDLPSNTLRVKFKSGYTPTMGDTLTLVDAMQNIWDIYISDNNWAGKFYGNSNLLEVMGANTTNVTYMGALFAECTALSAVNLFDTSNVSGTGSMFSYCVSLSSVPPFDLSNDRDVSNMFSVCTSLQSVPLYDTSNVNNMRTMFFNCSSLTYIPLFDTTNVSSMERTFTNCYNVEKGALAMYSQVSSHDSVFSFHNKTFSSCGINTVIGSYELSQIPDDWK